MQSKYPIYIPSKGRWESRMTVKALEEMNVPYYMVIEKEEYEKYVPFTPIDKILILPFSNKGLIASRCWIMDHSIGLGFKRHWQMDDNIIRFMRLNRNTKLRVTSGTMIRAAEDFTDRYENVALSGLNYQWLCKQKQCIPPYYLNTRIYSCTLVNNEIPYRWRSVYNDDTDISLCALKDGWCTILFNAFLADKATTMTMTGGNTEDLYLIEDGRKKMAEALVELHPDVARVSHKWGRVQHHVDYTGFKKNKLLLRKDVHVPEGINNYGMEIREI